MDVCLGEKAGGRAGLRKAGDGPRSRCANTSAAQTETGEEDADLRR